MEPVTTTPTATRAVTGINHVAVLTEDLDRFVEFYTSVFDLDVVFRETTPSFRHAILQIAPGSWLHPAEVHDGTDTRALPEMFARGHLDHLALKAADPAAFDAVRERLRRRSATDGAVEDLGAFHSLWFEDPDGMRAELVVVLDERLSEVHAPRRIEGRS